MNAPPKKRGLGRGLDALIGRPERTEPPDPATAASPPAPPVPAVVQALPIDALRPNAWQPRVRFAEEEIESLAESIRAQGLIQPIVVAAEADGSYSIVAGERRWRAARRAGLEQVPVHVRHSLDERTRLELALVENLQRSDLNPHEEAEAYLALQDKFGLSQEAIAARVGKARTTITNSLRLLKLPPEIQDLLRNGSLTAGQARPLLALPTPEAQIELAERAVREELSARQIERLTSPPTPAPPQSSRPSRPSRQVDVNTSAAEESLTRHLQTKVEIHRRGKGGHMRVLFHSEEELIRLYDLMMERMEPE